MKALNALKTPLAAQLIPSFKKTERKLLSVFMRVMDIVPEFRGHILELVDYRGGKTSKYKSFMEPTFDILDAPPLRPDGLIMCWRGSKEWSALIEAKSEKNHVRPDQIEGYTSLAKLLKVDAVISISNEFASGKGELPYTLNKSKKKGRAVHHLSWPQIASEMSLFMESKNKLNVAENMVLQEAIRYFSAKDSGVSTFDEMSPSWKDFVASANTVIGFSTATAGVAEIVKDWQQERRDLCIKLNQQVGGGVETWFPAKARNDPAEKRKLVREHLTKNYQLDALYTFKHSKAKLNVIADLRACSWTFKYELQPPDGKQIRALSTWLGKLLSNQKNTDFSVLFDWPGREPHSIHKAEDIIRHPEVIIGGRKKVPNTISFVTSKQGAARFKSRKRFIEDLEAGAEQLIAQVSRMELL